MTETTSEARKPGTPPKFVNAMLAGALRTPGLRNLLGKEFAVITVTGAKSGRRYSTPVQYQRLGDDYAVSSQRERIWWRNIRSRPEVELLVRGRTISGHAVVADDEAARRAMGTWLEQKPKIAKFYGVGVGEDGAIDPGGVDRLLEGSVVILISPGS